jgi:molybdate transport system substrate-binding protein
VSEAAEQVSVLSAGAVAPGVVRVIDAFRRETGHRVKVTFATAPAISKSIREPEAMDVVIAPPAVLDEWARAGKAEAAGRVAIGRIGVGVMVRSGAPLPKIATVDDFKQSLLSADSVVYNQASTGIYLEGLFDRLGIRDPLQLKSIRYPDAAAVIEHVGRGQDNEIGLGATTVIIEGQSKGIQFVGPLPAEIQNYTTYGATVTMNAGSGAARELVRYMTSPPGKNALMAAGIDVSGADRNDEG